MDTLGGIILDRTIPFADRLGRVVALRDTASRGVVDGVAFFLLYCWFLEHAVRRERNGTPRSPLAAEPAIRELVAESLAALGGEVGWSRMLSVRGTCACGVTNRLENIGVCVECATYECWECSGTHQCATGHEVVG